MPSRSRFAADVARKIFGIFTLLVLLFVSGCKSSDNASTIFYISSPPNLPAGAVSVGGGTYSATLQAYGGIEPYTWGLVVFPTLPAPVNVLPPGLSISSAGVIRGMPTTAGTYTFTVQVADSGGFTMTGTASITITAPLAIGTSGTTLVNTGVVGAVYSTTTLGVTGGIGTLICTLNSGNLPSGLVLTNATTAWAVSGTVGSSVTPGSYPFTIKCTDAQNDVLVSGPITITVNAAGPAANASSITSGQCSSGNEALLSGEYALLVKGASALNGYSAVIGSFNADGSGGISGGLMDRNGTSGPTTGLSISQTGSSYSVGSDNRGCLTLADSNGDTLTFRIALGMIGGSPSFASEGAMSGTVSNGTQGIQPAGILMQQDAAAFSSGSLRGTYVFGNDGIDSADGRFAEAGLLTADGLGNLTGISADCDDAYSGTATVSGGSGTYVIATNGRGTSVSTFDGETRHAVVYVVSSSTLLSMSTDPVDSSHPMLSGESKLQTATSFPTYLPVGSAYAFYTTGVDPSNGGGAASIGQATFSNASGSAAVTLDVNDNGIEEAESIGQAIFTIAPNGRMSSTGTGFGVNPHPPIIYLVDPTQGFIVGTDPAVSSGYFEQQTGGPFNTASIAGQAFFGGSAPAAGSPHDSGTLQFVPSSGTVTGNDDGSSSTFLAINGTPAPFTFSVGASFTPTAPGQGIIGSDTLAYIISASPLKIIFMPLGANPENANANPAELFIGLQSNF